jgi:hypothetical protein
MSTNLIDILIFAEDHRRIPQPLLEVFAAFDETPAGRRPTSAREGLAQVGDQTEPITVPEHSEPLRPTFDPLWSALRERRASIS